MLTDMDWDATAATSAPSFEATQLNKAYALAAFEGLKRLAQDSTVQVRKSEIGGVEANIRDQARHGNMMVYTSWYGYQGRLCGGLDLPITMKYQVSDAVEALHERGNFLAEPAGLVINNPPSEPIAGIYRDCAREIMKAAGEMSFGRVTEELASELWDPLATALARSQGRPFTPDLAALPQGLREPVMAFRQRFEMPEV